MSRKILACALLGFLGGCASLGDSAWWQGINPSSARVANFNFEWKISGDSQVAPLQAFDDGANTWLQYAPEQPAPAIFARYENQERLLHPQREGQFLRLAALPAEIIVRGGHYQARVWRASELAAPGTPATELAQPDLAKPEPAPQAAQTVALAPQAQAGRQRALPQAAPSAPERARALAPIEPPPEPLAAPKKTTAAENRPQSAMSSPAPGRFFTVTPADQNLRLAIGRWAKTAGWTFESVHWAVDADIPVAGSASFDSEFRAAVRELLMATELGDRPIQPCFYANRVLRVIPLSQRCDRTQQAGA